MKKFDPTLKQAMEDIKLVLAKYDIGGHVILGSKSHSEFLFHFPKWSKAQLEKEENGAFGVRFKAKGKDEDGTIASTVFFFQSIEQQCGRAFITAEKIMEVLSKKMEIAGGPVGPFTN